MDLHRSAAISAKADRLILQALIRDAVRGHPVAEEFTRRADEGKFAKIVSDLHFPTRGLMQHQMVGTVFTSSAGFAPEILNFIDHPQEGACIEEEVHYLPSAVGNGA